jgi:hypothetical protein
MFRSDPTFFNDVLFNSENVLVIYGFLKHDSVIFGRASHGRISTDDAWTRFIGGEFDSADMGFVGSSYHEQTIHQGMGLCRDAKKEGRENDPP